MDIAKIKKEEEEEYWRELERTKITDSKTYIAGWICPKCGSGVSPFEKVCPCNQRITTSDRIIL
jgi:rubrerythrin